MVYKKWIKKDGKLYGPYTYESKRVDGKVVSEYHGPTKTFALKKYSWVFVLVGVVLVLSYFLSTFDFNSLTGEAVLSTKIDYVPNQPISGNLTISLKQGELFPSNSKIILENSGQVYEYDLNKIVSDSTIEGNFYIEGMPLSGNGKGYGIEGEKTVYPAVSFILNIYPSENTPVTEPVPEPTPELPPVPAGNETKVTEETPVAESPVNETTEATPVTETTPTTETVPTSETTETTEAVPATETPAAETPPADENVDTSAAAETTSPITGFFAKIYGFFLGITPTGKAVSESGTTEINGEASFGSPFVYEISGGEGVQLKPGSVSVSGRTLPDDTVTIQIDGNKITAMTSYSEIQKGFGQGFLGEEIKTINIDLTDLGLVMNEGELLVKIVSGSDEIFSTSLALNSGETTSVIENVSNLNSTTLNITIEQPVNNTLNATTGVIFGEKVPQIINAETAQFVLTEEDKNLLSEKYGDIVISTTKSEIINGRLVKRYEIGKDWIAPSYNPNDSDEEIEVQSSKDRMKWLKDLAQRIKLKKEAAQEPPLQVIETFSVQ